MGYIKMLRILRYTFFRNYIEPSYDPGDVSYKTRQSRVVRGTKKKRGDKVPLT